MTSRPNPSDVADMLSHRHHSSSNLTENVDYNIRLGVNDIYSMTHLPYGERDVTERQNDIIGPLSLFAPYAYEENIEEEEVILVPSRPVTPIDQDEEIYAPVTSFKQLSTYVLRRIVAKEDRPFMDTEDQKELSGVLLGELNALWADFRRNADDPFLSKIDNAEVKRLMVVRIVEVCHRLFKFYVEKAQILNRRGVFTGPANVSRLKAQLSLDAHQKLNIASVKRWAQAEFSDCKLQDQGYSRDELDDKLQQLTRIASPRYRELQTPSVPSIRPPKCRITKKPFIPAVEISEMSLEMPTLKTEKLMSVLEEMDQLRDKPSPATQATSTGKELTTSSKVCTTSRCLQRSNSFNETKRHENLAYELDIDLPNVMKRSYSTHFMNIPSIAKNEPANVAEDEGVMKLSAEYLKNDLKNLLSTGDGNLKIKVPVDDDDVPPLLAALIRSSKHDGKMDKLRQQLKDLKKKEADYIERTQVRPHEKPKYPQPSTVSAKMPNKMNVRTSDIRVSERVCMSSFTIDKNGPLYNDVIGEVDLETVRNMDKNLFMGNEIKEVYAEIMPTVPTNHLELSNDELIQPTADDVKLSSILMPSALSRRSAENISNRSIQKTSSPPWGDQNIMTWAKTPVTQLREMRTDSVSSTRAKATEDEDVTNIPGKILSLDDYKAKLSDYPRQVQERLSRNYQSWITSWKNSLSTQDFQKYLVSQETDYLCYMYHYYESDDEESEIDKPRSKSKSKKSKSTSDRTEMTVEEVKKEELRAQKADRTERTVEEVKKEELRAQKADRTERTVEEVKKEELRAHKADYTPGYWNTSTVLMGGLGNDPDAETSDRESVKTPATDVTQASYMNLGSKIILKSESQFSGKSNPSELSKTIETIHNASLAEARRQAAENELQGPTAQQRLENVWSALLMPDSLKLDMAIKYSGDKYIERLNDAIDAWEEATELITKREQLLGKLENFERLASDPNRFFEKGFRGSSVARLDEAKQRSHHYKLLDKIGAEIEKLLTKVEEEFQDKVTFQGRPYMDKMHWDRIEMLFWLQEERKQHVLEKHTMTRGLPLTLPKLESTLQSIT